MDKITELEPRGAALKAELAEYRRRFRTRSISLELKRAAVAFVDEGIAAGMWQGHAAQLIGSSASTVEKWREAIADAEMECTGLLPVRVVDEPTRSKPPPRTTSQPVLLSPSGWRVEDRQGRQRGGHSPTWYPTCAHAPIWGLRRRDGTNSTNRPDRPIRDRPDVDVSPYRRRLSIGGRKSGDRPWAVGGSYPVYGCALAEAGLRAPTGGVPVTDILFTPDEVCARLRISRRHLYRLEPEFGEEPDAEQTAGKPASANAMADLERLAEMVLRIGERMGFVRPSEEEMD